MMRPSATSVRSLSLAVLVTLFSVGCGDSATEPDGITVADLVGSWTAASAVMTNKTNPSQQFDIIAAGGEMRVTVLNNGGARTWLELADFSDEWDAQITLNGNQLTSTPVESTRPTRHWTISVAGDRLTMTSTDGEWDFTLTGAPAVPANQVVVFDRN